MNFPIFGAEKWVEYHMYWAPELRAADSPLTRRIGEKLKEHGWEIRNWKFDQYFPWLLCWETVHSWQELKWWLGLDLPRKEPLLEDTAYCVFWNFGAKLKKCHFIRLPKDKLVLILWEPPVVEPEAYDPKMLSQFGKILTWDDDLVDNEKFFKCFYTDLRSPIEKIPSFEEKKFCTMIATRLTSKHPKELYSERVKAIRFFEDKVGEFDLYGGNWEKQNFKNSRGKINDKIDVLKNYKYSICYENTRDIKGYITEKIFDCFAAGVVPIYWGASNICDYIPKEAFIDRRNFQDEQNLYDFLKSITKEQYEEYLQAARTFTTSDEAQRFTLEHFSETLVSLLLH